MVDLRDRGCVFTGELGVVGVRGAEVEEGVDGAGVRAWGWVAGGWVWCGSATGTHSTGLKGEEADCGGSTAATGGIG